MQINIEFFYKLILSFCVCTFRHAKSTQNKKSTYLCNIFRRTWLMKLIFWLQISTNVFYKLLASLWVCVVRHAHSTQSNKFEYLRNTSRKTWRMKFIFCLQINIKCFFKIILSFWVSVASMPKLPKITSLLFFCNMLRERRVMNLIFLQADKHESFLQIDTMIFDGDGQTFSKFPKLQCLYNISKNNLEMKLIFSWW